MHYGITEQEIEKMLRDKLDIQEIEVIDFKGGNHFDVTVKASDFNGMTLIKQQRLVQQILAEPLADETIHALKLKTLATN